MRPSNPGDILDRAAESLALAGEVAARSDVDPARVDEPGAERVREQMERIGELEDVLERARRTRSDVLSSAELGTQVPGEEESMQALIAVVRSETSELRGSSSRRRRLPLAVLGGILAAMAAGLLLLLLPDGPPEDGGDRDPLSTLGAGTGSLVFLPTGGTRAAPTLRWSLVDSKAEVPEAYLIELVGLAPGQVFRSIRVEGRRWTPSEEELRHLMAAPNILVRALNPDGTPAEDLRSGVVSVQRILPND